MPAVLQKLSLPECRSSRVVRDDYLSNGARFVIRDFRNRSEVLAR